MTRRPTGLAARDRGRVRAGFLVAIALLSVLVGTPAGGAVDREDLASRCAPVAGGGERPRVTIDPDGSASTVGRFPSTDDSLPGWYRAPGPAALVDATGGYWWNPPVPDPIDPDGVLEVGTPLTLGSDSVARPDQCVIGGDITVGLPYATTSHAEWHGDARAAAVSDGVVRSPAETGGIETNNPRTSIVGSTIFNVGDGVSFVDRDGIRAEDWSLDGVRMSDVHDDCIENDSMNGGRVHDSLFDGCYVLYSATTGGGGADVDGSEHTVEITDSLFHLAAAPDSSRRCPTDAPPSCAAGPLEPGTGAPWKISELPIGGRPPEMVISGSTFLLDGYPVPEAQCPESDGDGIDEPCSVLTEVNLRFPVWCRAPAAGGSVPEAFDPRGVCDPSAPVASHAPRPDPDPRRSECPEPNLVIWAGADPLVDTPDDGDIVDQLATWGPCFRIVDADDVDPATGTRWRTVWEDRRQAWIAEHSAGGAYVGFDAPVLAHDSRNAGSTGAGGGALEGGSTRTVDLSAVPGLPSNAEVGAVVLRVTATNPSAASSAVTVWGEGSRPPAPSLVVSGGASETSEVVVLPGRIGRRLTPAQLADPDLCPAGRPVCPSDGSSVQVHNRGCAVDLRIDVVGFHRSTPARDGDGVPPWSVGRFHPVVPTRIAGPGAVGEGWQPGGRFGVGGEKSLRVTGAGVPRDARTVVLNVHLVAPTRPTVLGAIPTGVAGPPAPLARSEEGDDLAVTATVPVGADGRIRMRNSSGEVAVHVDIVGFSR